MIFDEKFLRYLSLKIDFRVIQNRKIRIFKKQYFRLKIDLKCFLGQNFIKETSFDSKKIFINRFQGFFVFFN